MTPRTIAHQAALSMEFSKQEFWSRLPFPSPKDLPNPGIKPRLPTLQADSSPMEPPGKPNYEDNGDLLQKVLCMHCCTRCPQPCSRPPSTHASIRDSWTLTGKSGSVSCGVTAPFSWVLWHKVLFVPSQSLFPQSSVSSGGSMVG